MKLLKTIAALFGGLVVVAIASLWIAGFRKGAGHYEYAVDINRPAADVWPWITEPEKQKKWISWLSEARTLTPDPFRVGSREAWVMVDPGMNSQRIEIDSEVTSVVPNERLELRVASRGMFSGDAAYRLTPLPGGGTRVLNYGDYRYDQWFSRLLEPLVSPEAQKKLKTDMGRLKALVEEGGR
ncbi:MAG: SRPBCC family protein [Acidobacteriia bacterium]|nr:SRPBCC family protein [Terriglobia bacterium]